MIDRVGSKTRRRSVVILEWVFNASDLKTCESLEDTIINHCIHVEPVSRLLVFIVFWGQLVGCKCVMVGGQLEETGP